MYSIGIDIGGTKIATGIVHSSGDVFHEKVYLTPKETNKTILELLKEIISTYVDMAEKSGMELSGIGIGSAGQVMFREGKILSGTNNIRDWNNVNIYEYLSQYTSLPILVDNDANAFAVAEHQFGKGKGIDNIVFLTIGTGIGGGVIADGTIIRGEWGGAAELGHITVNMSGPICNCGSRGCIETYASGTGIANRMKEKIDSSVATIGTDIAYYKNNPEKITSKEVFRWYEEGVPGAIGVIELGIEALAYGIVNLIHTFNPSLIVLGGGLMDGRDWLAPVLKQRISELGIGTLVRPVELSISELGANAGLIGAASLVWME